VGRLREAEFTERELSGVGTPFWRRRREWNERRRLCDAEGADAERACGAPTLAADDHESLTRHGTSAQTQDDRGWINAP
jgi:hypothetical protein